MLGILVIVSVNVISCDIGEYLDYENCKCKKKLVAPLIEECTETVEEVNLANITLSKHKSSYKCNPCTVYIVLLLTFFTINVSGIVTYYAYSEWYLKKYSPHVNFNTYKETTIYKTYKWEKLDITLKIELIIFTTTKLI